MTTMRYLLVVLTLCATASLAGGRPAGADEGPLGLRADLGGTAYSNNDGLRVLGTSVGAAQTLGHSVLRGGGKVDFITAASVDMITAASPGFVETRKEGLLDFAYQFRGLRGSAGYVGSTESDTTTHLMSASGSIDLLERNLTLGLGYALGIDSVGTHDAAPSLWRDRTSHRIDAMLTQVLGPSTVMSATYTFQETDGYLASPYRRVPILPRSPDLWNRQNAQWVAERHPDSRGRHALTAILRHALSTRLFAHAEWRGYLDTWSMRSNAVDVGIAWDLNHDFLIGLSNRFYEQSAVSFFRPIYTVNREYITRDRRLSEYISDALRLDLRYHARRFDVLLQGSVDWTRYLNYQVPYGGVFQAMPDTWAFIGQVGLGFDL